ncbi:uncharacterized protein [Ptychodera flava]|uniref:uncharacterized protein n=1 Tax=Ptychodera flava TaxID=63121 RepID=UPI00396A7A73
MADGNDKNVDKNKKLERVATFVARNLTFAECRAVCRELDVTRVAFDTIAREHANDVETQKCEWILNGTEKRADPLGDIRKALKECEKIHLIQQLDEYLKDMPCNTAISTEESRLNQNNTSDKGDPVSQEDQRDQKKDNQEK